jgi:hypothetical protein
LQAPYAGITRSGSVGRRTRAVVRTPPSQPTMWCELPKVSFATLTLTPRRKLAQFAHALHGLHAMHRVDIPRSVGC